MRRPRFDTLAHVRFDLELRHVDDAGAARAPDPPLPRDADVWALRPADAAAFAAQARQAAAAPRVAALLVFGNFAGAELDRAGAGGAARVFLRSARILDPVDWLARNNALGRRDFRFGALGTLGQFGNQLFQLWHLILYSLRHSARAGIAPWPYNAYFRLSFLEREGRGPAFDGDLSQWRIMGLWGSVEPPDALDFHEYFQWIPPFLACHRDFLRGCFALRPEWAAPMDAFLAELNADGRPLVAFHVRRGDYVTLGESNTTFRLIPAPWYRHALSPLGGAVIYAASDDLGHVKREFADLDLVTGERWGEGSLPPLLIDHCVMRAADTLLAVNSSFSRSAAMLAAAGQVVLLPSVHREAFEPYDPWDDPVFWMRFYDWSYREFRRHEAEVRRWLDAAGVPRPAVGG